MERLSAGTTMAPKKEDEALRMVCKPFWGLCDQALSSLSAAFGVPAAVCPRQWCNDQRGQVLSAEGAAVEKALAGESRAVEHVAELHASQVLRAASLFAEVRGLGSGLWPAKGKTMAVCLCASISVCYCASCICLSLRPVCVVSQVHTISSQVAKATEGLRPPVKSRTKSKRKTEEVGDVEEAMGIAQALGAGQRKLRRTRK